MCTQSVKLYRSATLEDANVTMGTFQSGWRHIIFIYSSKVLKAEVRRTAASDSNTFSLDTALASTRILFRTKYLNHPT
jgi:hypothetical protein